MRRHAGRAPAAPVPDGAAVQAGGGAASGKTFQIARHTQRRSAPAVAQIAAMPEVAYITTSARQPLAGLGRVQAWSRGQNSPQVCWYLIWFTEHGFWAHFVHACAVPSDTPSSPAISRSVRPFARISRAVARGPSDCARRAAPERLPALDWNSEKPAALVFRQTQPATLRAT